MKLFPTSFLLGLAGIDPSGAILIITSLAMGIKKSKITLFVITVILGTILVGLISSNIIVDTSVDYIANIFNYVPNYIYMILEFIIGIILLKWFIERTFFKEKKLTKEKKKESIFTRSIKKGLFFVGLLFAITAVLDPSFLAIITLLGQSDNQIHNTLSVTSWILISQLPMMILYIAVLFNKHEKLIQYLKNKIATGKRVELFKKIIYISLSIIILLAAILSLTEAIYYFITNTWLF